LFARKLVLLTLTLILIGSASAQELKIAAAADLTVALEKVAVAFKKQSGIQLKVSYGSSGNFFSQIKNGAPFDVFLSADRDYPDTLDGLGKTDKGTVIYAQGRLVLWLAAKTGLDPYPNLSVLTSSRINKIAIANPSHAPYGRAAVAAMSHFGVYDQIKPKLVTGENVAQAAQFGQSGNAEAALIPMSLALDENLRKGGRYAIVPDDSYPPLLQAAVVLRASQNKPEAHRFVEFLRSAAAQKIFTENGFQSLNGLQSFNK
jgi:molybdate transport system substrate-binding protein